MKAAIYAKFSGPVEVVEVSDPVPAVDGVVVGVRASGLCLSDWHGWRGSDPDITLPHVPGHEFAGVVEEIGSGVERWKVGDRVTVPFVSGCGKCRECRSGNQQVCDRQFQPGFTHWGSFAERVGLRYADLNLVRLPDAMTFTAAASLGCRFVTAFRAIVAQGRVAAGEWVAVHGCGGVGLSAVTIARAFGARVIGIDVHEKKVAEARRLGAEHVLLVGDGEDVAGRIREETDGGAHLSVDALGSRETCLNSIRCLRKRGRHIQVGLMTEDASAPPLPMDRILAHELEIRGSHGIQAHAYPAIFAMMREGRLDPGGLVGRTISLEEAAAALPAMDRFEHTGMTVITRF